MKNRKKILLAIGFYFFLILQLVLRFIRRGVIVTDAGERILMILSEEVIVTDAMQEIYWVLIWISWFAVVILGTLWKRELTKGKNDSAANEDTNTEDSSAC